MRPHKLLIPLSALILTVTACRNDPSQVIDAGPDAGPTDGTIPGGRDTGFVDETCQNPEMTAPASGTCQITSPGQGPVLLRGDVVAPTGLLTNGHVLISASGKVLCAACDCSSSPEFAQATVVECANGMISPAMINTHDHLTFSEGSPVGHGQSRYDHRHQWRIGQDGKAELDTPRSSRGDEPIWYSELRQIMGGAVSVVGAGGAEGLMRNLDRSGAMQEGLGQDSVRYSTFPLDDVRGLRRTDGCNYGTDRDQPDDGNIVRAIAYATHIAEGVNVDARNEYLCMSRSDNGGADLILDKTAVIHGIGLLAVDYAEMAADGASLIWSPRTNIDLYGITADVTAASRLGVNIALGTDWPSSGSMNMIRELSCADELNRRNYANYFADRELIEMASAQAASAIGSEGRIGSLSAGSEADITIWNKAGRNRYRAIIDARAEDVALVMRSGLPLYGDLDLVDGLTDNTGCEAVDVCGSQKRACVERETNETISSLRAAVDSSTIDLFFCDDVPPNEPTCIPFRPMEFTGIPDGMDSDGDGIADDRDNCPAVFNPVRPLDNSVQADDDQDGEGNACDVCPLNAMTTTCSAPDPGDSDGDTVPNPQDNCPSQPNPNQEDGDADGTGDACDRCPAFANPNNGACKVSIYDVRQGSVTGNVLLSNMIVTASGVDGYFVQTIDGDADFDATLRESYSGIFVFDRNTMPRPVRGDRVDVSGMVTEFAGEMQVSISTLTALSSGNPLPTPVAATTAEIGTGGARVQELLGVLVEVRNVTVTNSNPDDPDDFGEFLLDDLLRVDDFFFLLDPRPQVNEAYGYVRGPLSFRNDNSKILPRDLNDIDVTPTLLGFDPNPVFVPANSTGVPPGGFAVVMSRSVDQATQVTLSSSSTGTSVPVEVTIPAGQSRVDVPVTAGPAETAPITITANDGNTQQTATLRVYDDASVRTILSLTLDQNAVQPNGTVNGIVTLDLPGASAGTTVTFVVAPMSLALVNPVTIAAGTFSQAFTLSAGATEGSGTLTAQVGADTEQVSFNVSATIMGVPMNAGDVVISEIMKDPQTLADADGEWFEIYNPSTNVIYDLDGCTIADQDTDSIDISGTLLVDPESYVTLSRGPDPGFTPTYVYGPGNDFQLANGTDEVVIRCGGTEIDVVMYNDGEFPDDSGSALNLASTALDATQNDMGTNWCAADSAYNGDNGTPGAANRMCP